MPESLSLLCTDSLPAVAELTDKREDRLSVRMPRRVRP